VTVPSVWPLPGGKVGSVAARAAFVGLLPRCPGPRLPGDPRPCLPVLETGLKPPCPERGGFRLSRARIVFTNPINRARLEGQWEG